MTITFPTSPFVRSIYHIFSSDTDANDSLFTGSGEGLTGGVTQRFPEHDWPDMRFPDRIEWVCSAVICQLSFISASALRKHVNYIQPVQYNN